MDEVKRYESAQGVVTGVTHAVLAETYDGCPRFSRPESIQAYMKLVKDATLRRKLIRYAEVLSVQAAQPDADPQDLVLQLSAKGHELAQNTALLTDLVSTETAISRTFQYLEDSWARGGDCLGLSTGFQDLDRNLLGLQPGVYVIAAGTSVGKTTFTLNIVNNILLDAAKKNEKRVGALISMEMGVESLTIKMLATRAHLSTRDIRKGTLNNEQRRDLMRAGQELAAQGLHFVEGFNAITPSAIAAKVEHLRATHGRLDFLVVDYLQLLDSDNGGSGDYAAVTEISRKMKQLSHRYQIPILLISQLSRNYTNRTNRDYQLSDLRGSGAIEQDANVVMFLMPRDWDDETNPERRLVIAKDREGAKNITIPLLFIGEQSRFESMTFAV
jgi:replicative DNA helicase